VEYQQEVICDFVVALSDIKELFNYLKCFQIHYLGKTLYNEQNMQPVIIIIIIIIIIIFL